VFPQRRRSKFTNVRQPAWDDQKPNPLCWARVSRDQAWTNLRLTKTFPSLQIQTDSNSTAATPSRCRDPSCLPSSTLRILLFIGIRQHKDLQELVILLKNQSPDPLQVLESEPRIFQNLIINSIDETVQSFALAIPISLSVSNKWLGSLSKSSSDMLHMLHMHLGLVNTICKYSPNGISGISRHREELDHVRLVSSASGYMHC
jgi:hypothetical protein